MPSIYRPRRPRASPLWQVVHHCWSDFVTGYEGRREVFVGPEGRRTAIDYALALRHLAETIHPGAERIVLVQDNLNTHGVASPYEAFPPEEERRLASRNNAEVFAPEAVLSGTVTPVRFRVGTTYR